MKLKRLVEDFQVDEQIALEATGGRFALYRLTKQSLGTREAIDAIAEKWKLRRERIAIAGLKDKHALTKQYVTIDAGPPRGISQQNLELEYVGQVPRPLHASDIQANRFDVIIRDLSDDEIEQTTRSVTSVSTDGVPNYFDNQRFGSLGESGEFIGRPWCLGDYERAIWLAIADANVHDRPRDRAEKQVIRERWGEWNQIAEELSDSMRRSIVEHLANGGDFRQAITRVRQDLRSLWLAAFQSHLWNQVLAALIRQVCQPNQLQLEKIGQRELTFFRQIDDQQRSQLAATVLPLPSARLKLEDGPLRQLYDSVLAAEGMELRQVRVKYPRDSFFSKGMRATVVQPNEFRHQFDPDDLYPGRQKLRLSFHLPRGSYATILVKQIAGRRPTRWRRMIETG